MWRFVTQFAKENSGIDRKHFGIILQLLSAAQQGLPITLEQIGTLPPPHLNLPSANTVVPPSLPPKHTPTVHPDSTLLDFFSGAQISAPIHVSTPVSSPVSQQTPPIQSPKPAKSVDFTQVPSSNLASTSTSSRSSVTAVKQFAATHFGNNYGLLSRIVSEASNDVEGSLEPTANLSSSTWAAVHPSRLKILSGLDEESKQGAVYSKFKRRIAGQ